MAQLQVTTVWQKNWDAINERNIDGTRKYRYIINKGSSRSSKTYSLIDLYDVYARSQDNKRMTVWRSTKTDCKKTVLNDTLKHLKKTGRYGTAQIFNKTESIFTYATDSTFEIHGTDDVETVHGLTQDVAWLNEPYGISREIFDQIDQRTSDFLIIDMNPKMGHWIEDLEKDSRSIVIHSTFQDNPFCPVEQRNKILSYQSVLFSEVVRTGLIQVQDAKVYDLDKNELEFTPKQIRELIRCRENENKNSANDYNWQVYGLGEKAERPNRILHFKEISEDDYLKLDVKRYYGVDWGAVDPWGIVEVKYYDGALYVKEINYDSENILKAKLTTVEAQQIEKDGEGFVKWYFRKLGISEKAELVCDPNKLSKIAALRAIGYSYAVPAAKPPGSINFGIDTLNNMPVYYTSKSPNLKYEQENYSWKVDRYGIVLEEAEDTNNHCIDPLRYVTAHLRRLGIIKGI